MLAILIAGWLAWRWPALTRDVSTIIAATEPASAVPTLVVAAARMNGEPAQSPTLPQLALAGQYVPSVEPSDRRDQVRAVPAAAVAVVAVAVAVAVAGQLPDHPPSVVEARAAAAPVAARSNANADLADQAYALLANRHRRAAASMFRRALAAGPDDPRAPIWATQLGLMERRWSGSAYVFARASGISGATAAPVLGGGQSGAQISYSLDPLAAMPLSLLVRASAANKAGSTAQTALGLSWQLRPGITLAAERLVPAGPSARAAWALRIAGGTAVADVGSYARSVEISAYAEAGMIGLHRRDLYGAATARIGRRLAWGGRGAVVPGLAAWGSLQHADSTVSRLEIGPSLQLRLQGPLSIGLSADYRVLIAGNARPASGPALTITTAF